MKKVFAILAVAAAVSACTTTTPSDTYDKRVDAERVRRETAVEKSVERAPKWMTDLPVSTSAVYANGSAVSQDMSMADYKAKLFAYGKICMAAGGKVSQQSKVFLLDNSSASYETSEVAIRGVCPDVDITGVETKEVKRIAEGTRFRSYVLVALPTGDANVLKKQKDQTRLQSQAAGRSRQAFEELDTVATEKQQ
jgi:hypothetical protein